LTISELAAALRAVTDTLEQARAITATVVPQLAESKTALLVVRQEPNGYTPVELDIAMAELGTAGDLIARARQSIMDYLMRL
jgi:hypothetical protein